VGTCVITLGELSRKAMRFYKLDGMEQDGVIRTPDFFVRSGPNGQLTAANPEHTDITDLEFRQCPKPNALK
jgi:hypothetical protein